MMVNDPGAVRTGEGRGVTGETTETRRRWDLPGKRGSIYKREWITQGD